MKGPCRRLVIFWSALSAVSMWAIYRSERVGYYAGNALSLSPVAQSSDFFQLWTLASLRDPYSANAEYPPAFFVLVRIANLIGSPYLWLGLSISALLFTCAAVISASFKRTRSSLFGSLVFGTLFPPVWYCIDRGSSELIIAVLIILGTAMITKDKIELGSFLIGLASGLKILPIVFLFLLRDHPKRRRGLLTALSAVVGINLVSLSFLPSETARSFMSIFISRAKAQGSVVRTPELSALNMSVEAWARVFFEVCARFANVADNIDKWILIAGVLRVAIVLFLAAFLFRKNIHYVTKMVLITAIYATVAYVSPFYRLIPIIVVVGALASESVRPRDRLVRLLLVFLVVAPLPSPVVFSGSTAMIQLIRLPSLLLLCGILIASELKDKRRLIR